MNLSKKIIVPVAGLAAVLVAVIIILFATGRDPVKKKFEELEGKPTAYTPSQSVLESVKFKEVDGHIVIDGELTMDQMVALLRKKYGANIKHPLMQMRMLQELLRYLKQKYPNNWVEYLHEVLGAAFPDLANKLFTMSKNLYIYDKFLNDTREKAAKMSGPDRDKLLWDKRYELFGSEADQIWWGEKRNADVQSALKEISQNKNASMKEKIDQFKDALNKTYGEQLQSVMVNHQQNFLDGFVGAVQDDLQNMNPTQRAAALRDIRSSLGMDEAALTRWEGLDQERAQRWSNGQIYMNEKKQLSSQYTGTDLDQKLDELRHRLFGEEADTIKSEESSGYNRFEGKQQYGIN